MKNIAVFASGTGSNFLAINEAIHNKTLNTNITLLVSDRPNCKAVENALRLGINVFAYSPKSYKLKTVYEKEIIDHLLLNNVQLIVLAGYMRIIGPTLLSEYENRILNIHPSYLPNYKGMDAIGQALSDNATFTGVTVHYVDEGMDTGSIIEQVRVEITENETRESLESKIHIIEHILYPNVIKKVLEELLWGEH